MRKALCADLLGMAAFEAMANSHKTRYIVWIESAKRKETRQRRIDELVRLMLERARG